MCDNVGQSTLGFLNDNSMYLFFTELYKNYTFVIALINNQTI